MGDKKKKKPDKTKTIKYVKMTISAEVHPSIKNLYDKMLEVNKEAIDTDGDGATKEEVLDQLHEVIIAFGLKELSKQYESFLMNKKLEELVLGGKKGIVIEARSKKEAIAKLARAIGDDDHDCARCENQDTCPDREEMESKQRKKHDDTEEPSMFR